MFYKIGIFKNFAKFKGKHCARIFLNKVADLSSGTGVFVWVLLVFKGALSGLMLFLATESRKSFENDEKCFLFHLKSFFRPQDI